MKARLFWPIVLLVLLTDCATKRLAVEHLSPAHVPHDVAGDAFRLTLAYNPGAAFGITAGPFTRWVFVVTSLVVLAILARIYQRTSPDDRLRLAALALVTGGAVGNLVDRVRSPLGVVDFVDVGLGEMRFWTFNVADVGVSIGGLLLVWSLLRASSDPGAAAPPDRAARPPGDGRRAQL